MADSSASAEAAAAPAINAEKAFFLFAATLLVLRIAGLFLTPLTLHPDEAQYWAWSRTLAWGYFSKPPLLAWIIGATTSVLGDAEWAVRAPAPVFHTLAASMLFLLARRLYGPWAGFWAGAGWLIMPGVWVSAALFTTDALLLPIWAAALYCAWTWVKGGHWVWALLLGAAIGFGLLAKYAMLYFPLGLCIWAALSRETRAKLFSPAGFAAIGVAGLMLAPHIWWNAGHRFSTVKHTAANANLGADLFHPEEGLQFLADQIGVGGFFAVALLVIMIAKARSRERLDDRARFLLCFIAPTLLVIAVQSLLSRSNANWAAAAYPAVIVLVTGLLHTPALRWINGAHLACYAIFFALAIAPDAASRLPLLGAPFENGLKRMREWDVTARAVEAQVRQGGPYTALLVDHRHLYYELSYYLRDAKDLPPLRMWLLRQEAGNEAEASAPITKAYDGRVFVAHQSPHNVVFLRSDFAQATPAGDAEIQVGPSKKRPIIFTIASGFAPRRRVFAAEKE